MKCPSPASPVTAERKFSTSLPLTERPKLLPSLCHEAYKHISTTQTAPHLHRFKLDPKAAAMSEGGTLPQEIITDILSRLPVKSLCRFKCVSPLWNSLISDPHFVKTHLKRTKTQNPKSLDRKFIITADKIYSVDFADQNPTGTELSFPMVEKRVRRGKRIRVLSSYDGLLLVSLRCNSRFFLLNPSTRECKKLPIFPLLLNPVYRFYSSMYGVGYDSSTDDYKVLMLSEGRIVIGAAGKKLKIEKTKSITIGAVYSLKTNAWRRIRVPVYYFDEHSGGVFFNGCIHGICWTAVSKSKVIVAFNLSDEIFREVPHPASLPGEKMSYHHVAVLGGRFCLVENRGSGFWSIWMMREYGIRESWTNFTFRCGWQFLDLLCLLGEDELLMTSVFYTLAVYNVQKDTVREMVVCGIPEPFSFEGSYIESLVSPHHGGGIGGQ